MASTIKVNTIQDAGGNSLLVSNGSGTITTNNINVKDLDWQSVVSTDTTMVAGRGYFVDSSGGTKTMTLPASPSVGDTVAVNALDGSSNEVTIARNSSKIEGGTNDLTISTDYGAVTLVFSDAANGWIRHNNESPDSFVAATGGTTSTTGNFKIHTFNSSGNFVVSSLSSVSDNNEVSYVVVGGGGGAGRGNGGGGGAGGFREGKSGVDSYTQSPLNAPAGGITVTATTFPITVGSGGAGRTGSGGRGTSGSNSTFSTITSAGGGGGGSNDSPGNGFNGGSGGGGGNPNFSGGSGNTPPVSPSQGNNGGNATASSPAAAGGGGAGGTGGNTPGPSVGGAGGNSVSSSITGSSVARAGGGGGGVDAGGTSGSVSGGGGAGATGCSVAGTNGTANTGGGAGGGGGGGGNGGTGGSGVVILRYKYQ